MVALPKNKYGTLIKFDELTFKDKSGKKYKDRLYLILVDNKPIIKLDGNLKRWKKRQKINDGSSIDEIEK